MKFNKKAVQRELDLASETLERAGHQDLAAKLDYYSDRLMTATTAEIPLVRRAFVRLQEEAKKRMKASSQPDPKPAKAQAAVLRSRRASTKRKEALRRRLKTIAAKRKKAADRLASLRAGRKDRATRRSSRKERLARMTRRDK